MSLIIPQNFAILYLNDLSAKIDLYDQNDLGYLIFQVQQRRCRSSCQKEMH